MAAQTDKPKAVPPQPIPYTAPDALGVGFQTNPQYGGVGPTQSVTAVPTQQLGVAPRRPT